MSLKRSRSLNFKPMEGITYIIDQTNNRRYVQIDLDKYGELWEDFQDTIEAELSKNDETFSVEEVITELQTKGNLDKYL